ncbi:MAG: hypothetical protein PHY12_03930 [Eubacteriales bacterium]|nr:hypothetical protein [Eubacteriales bacterium]
MKKLISLLFVALTVLAPLGSLAETNNDYVSLAVLSQQALSGWHETYAAHGREVIAQADILWMPETDACPIVEIERMEMNLDEQVLEKYRGKGNTVDVSSKNHYVSIHVDSKMKNYFLKGYSGGTGGLWDENDVLFHHGEIPDIQPEGLDCTYQQFYDFMGSRVKELTGIGLDSYWTQRLSAHDVIWKAKERDGSRVRVAPMTRWGSWGWCGYQMFHGIPMQFSGAAGPTGYAICNYYGENTYVIDLFPVVETAVQHEDVPLLSFEAMKQIWEEQIEAGKLRGVDELSFCYIAFLQNDAQGERWVLQPVWMLTGGYTEDVGKEQVMPYHDERDTDGSLTCPEEYRPYYYNAQTGEMLQMPAEYGKPLMAYEVLTWDDVNG